MHVHIEIVHTPQIFCILLNDNVEYDYRNVIFFPNSLINQQIFLPYLALNFNLIDWPFAMNFLILFLYLTFLSLALQKLFKGLVIRINKIHW